MYVRIVETVADRLLKVLQSVRWKRGYARYEKSIRNIGPGFSDRPLLDAFHLKPRRASFFSGLRQSVPCSDTVVWFTLQISSASHHELELWEFKSVIESFFTGDIREYSRRGKFEQELHTVIGCTSDYCWIKFNTRRLCVSIDISRCFFIAMFSQILIFPYGMNLCWNYSKCHVRVIFVVNRARGYPDDYGLFLFASRFYRSSNVQTTWWNLSLEWNS